MANVNQIRITLETNKVLVYDYFVSAWCVFTNINAVDSVIWNATHSYIRSNGQTLVETPNTFTDDGVHYNLKVTTTWLNLSGIQGFERLWHFYILGNYLTPHQLSVKLYYDYNSAYSQEIIINPVIPNFYGQDVYGLPSGSVYGGEYSPYQYRVNPARQKCMNMKVQIQDLPYSGSLDAALDISNLRFEYGVEGGGNRVRKRQYAG